MNKRPKLLFHSCYSSLKTGFSRHAKTLLSELYKRDNIEIVELANAPTRFGDKNLNRSPWKVYGSLPSDEILQTFNEQQRHLAGYGCWALDQVIKEERPNVYMGVEDAWAFPTHPQRPWFNKICSILHTPIDSLPLLSIHKELAANVKNIWCKAPFATKALADEGFHHAKTVPALIDATPFFPLPEEDRLALRRQVGISDDTLVVGYLFRNQIRKLVGTLLDGFKLFVEKNPDKKCILWLHTDWREPAWNIPKMIEDLKLDNNLIYTSYVCHACRNVQIRPYGGQELPCPACNRNALFTAGVELGLTESELNLGYNLCDGYVHPATSGGFEIPVLEACLAGVPIAVPNYACFETYCGHPDTFQLEHTFYREVNSGFLKCQPFPSSVCDAISHFYSMGRSGRKEAGSRLREWGLEKFSVQKWVDWIEDFIIKNAVYDYDFNFDAPANEHYEFYPYEEPKTFITNLYKNVFHADLDESNEDFRRAVDAINNGIDKRVIYDDFIRQAKEFNTKNKKTKIEDILDNNGKKRILYVVPSTQSDCLASLPVIEELFNVYPEFDFYLSTEKRNFPLFAHLTKIKMLLEYEEWMDNVIALEGQGEKVGYFDICFHPTLVTRKFHHYSHNGLDINKLQL